MAEEQKKSNKKGFFAKIYKLMNKSPAKEQKLTVMSAQGIVIKGQNYEVVPDSAEKRKKIIRESLADKGGF